MINYLLNVLLMMIDIIATVQNEEEYENDSDNEYESQPIISVKSSFRKCGQPNAV